MSRLFLVVLIFCSSACGSQPQHVVTGPVLHIRKLPPPPVLPPTKPKAVIYYQEITNNYNYNYPSCPRTSK